MPKFNPQQQAAIDIRHKNVLVSAPAGSGKTRILVARIMDLIMKDHYQIDEFLVLTFTEAAGKEMKQRLNDSLNEALRETESIELKEHIMNQIEKLPQGYITTFDSFCKTILEKYGYIIQVMPGFEVNPSPDLLQMQAFYECIEEWLKTEEFKEYLRRYNTQNHFDSFKEDFMGYMNTINAYPDFYTFFEQSYHEIQDYESFEESTIFELVIQRFKLALSQCIENLNILSIYCENNGIEGFFEDAKNPSPFHSYEEYIHDLTLSFDSPLTYDTFQSLLLLKKGKASTIKWKQDGLEEYKKEYQDLSKKVLEPFNKLKTDFSFTHLEDFKKILELTHKDCAYLLGKDGLLAQFVEKYNKYKKELNQLDFHDLEENALKLLSPEYPVLEILNHTFKEIMIDEYQDTNQLQETLVTNIATYDRTIPLFMVGDMKQSIYRFRQADPENFIHKFNTYTPYQEESDSSNIRIDLTYNYRSQKAVLDSINYIFDGLMDSQIGGLEYYKDPYALLHYDYDVKNRTLDELRDVHDYDTDVLLYIHDESKKLTRIEGEAHMVAQKIQQLVSTGYEYKDICVLMGVTTEFMTYKKIFEQYHIPANINLSGGLLGNNEVLLLVELLKSLLNPYDDIALLSVLHAPFTFSRFKENELLEIRDKDNSLYQNLLDSDLEKVQNFLHFYHLLREYTFSHSPYEILCECLKYTKYQEFVSGLVNGEQRSANIDALVSLFENDTTHHYLEEMIALLEEGFAVSPGKIVSDDNNAVEFMTIHKSKGLQFKVVFVSYLHHKFNDSDSTKFIQMHNHYGVTSKYKQRQVIENIGEMIVEYPNPYHRLLGHITRKENLDESLRLLYVALTRAEDKLILTGSLKEKDDIDKLVQKLHGHQYEPLCDKYGVILNPGIRNVNNFLDWILLSLLRHKDVRETLYEETRGIKEPKQIYTEETILSHFHLSLINDNDILPYIPTYQREEPVDMYDHVKKYYTYQYPYENKSRSIAVTTLQKLEDEVIFKDLEVNGMDRVKAQSFGTLIHNVLSFLNFKNDNTDTLIDSLYKSHFLSDEDYMDIKEYKNHIDAFIHSDIYNEISHADKVHKEKVFRYKTDEQVINGIFDLVYMKDNKVYVLDYKTDHITKKNSIEQLMKKHQLQLLMYKKVLEEYYHLDTIAYVYYLETNQCIEIKEGDS